MNAAARECTMAAIEARKETEGRSGVATRYIARVLDEAAAEIERLERRHASYSVRLADKCGEFGLKDVQLTGHTFVGALEVFRAAVRRYHGQAVDVSLVNVDAVDLGCPTGLSVLEEELVEECRHATLRGAA